LTLIEFLTARLAEDEQAARAAKPGPWRWDTSEGAFHGEPDPPGAPKWGHRGPDLVTDAEVDDRQVISSTGYDADSVIVERADAEHIARHDPARVLADVEAKRRIVEHMQYEIDPGLVLDVDQPLPHHIVLRLLALPYASDPEYRAEWRP